MERVISEDEFEQYWDKYGELHASFSGRNIKQFAKEFWCSSGARINNRIIAVLQEIITEYRISMRSIINEVIPVVEVSDIEQKIKELS